jgi:hypothetical protein
MLASIRGRRCPLMARLYRTIGGRQRSPGSPHLVVKFSDREPSLDPEDRTKLGERVRAAAERALARQGYVSPVDLLLGLGWLDASHLKRWTLGQAAFLEAGIQTNPRRVSEALRCFRTWASEKGLRPSETDHVSRTPERSILRFSESGESGIERGYGTHWVSPDLGERERQRLGQKVNRPPELVVFEPSGDWAKAASPRYAVVVRFSRARKRYERQGLLVEAAALRSAKQDQGTPRKTRRNSQQMP